jgi:spore coat-associated protein N
MRTRSQRRRSMTKKLVASTALVGGSLALAFGGAFATFADTASGASPVISSGKIVIAVGPNNDTTPASNIVPGDTIAREVDLNSTSATANAASITLGIAANPTSLLDTDATNGLQLQLQSCATAPTSSGGTAPTYTCTGGFQAVTIGGQSTVSIASLESAPATLGSLNSLTAGGQDYLVMTLSLPSSAPGDFSKVTTACSGPAGGTSSTENMEGCSSTLSYKFTATQRAGTTK